MKKRRKKLVRECVVVGLNLFFSVILDFFNLKNELVLLSGNVAGKEVEVGI